MKLLDVKAVLVRERDIQKTDPNREILKELDDKDTRYAILSHRWGAEVNYEEMTGLMKMRKEERKEVRERYGYQKIIKSCEQAMKDGYEWLWIDTCCIDKRSSTELSEAINSMYRWYRNAQVCYAYLNDVDEEVFPVERNYSKFKSNGCPEWFVRGWTLQELIAPKQLEFFNMAWVSIGNKRRLALALKDITKIPPEVVRDGLAAKRPCIAQIMSWAADRKTTRVEDRAYSLMGLFGVNMPMLYGEGEKAFQRLQLEIIRTSSDHSVFAWGSQNPRTGSVLADDPSDFRGCGDMKSLEHKEFVDRLARYISSNERANAWFSSRKGLGQYKFLPSPIYVWRGERLGRRARSLSQPLRTFSVSNAGIQMFLPVIPYPNSPSHLRALLACRLPNEPLATIDLVFSGSSFERTLSTTDGPTALPEFKTLYLTYNQDANETRREFTLDDEHASYHGFTRRGTFPRKFPGDTVTLSSLTDDLIVIVYANDDVKSRFAVGLGYYLHQGWVHVVCDDQEADWTAFAKNAHARMWKARAKHAQSMPKRLDDPNPNHEDHFIKHAHLPRSIWGARVVWGDWEMDNFKVMVDVEQCPGCCDGPCTWTTKSWRGLDTPGLMLMNHQPYECRLDGWPAQLDECSGQRIALGDYGDYSDGNFKCTGNIFEDTRTPGVDPVSSDCAVVSRVAGNEQKRDGPVVIPRGRISYLALHQPKGLSLPTNKCIMLLLKTLSTRAAGKHLVITVIQCSDFYRADSHGKRMDPRDVGTTSQSRGF
ncbi:heterokaryon incompatibility protein-domain-containing protein [Pisolithus tinctorius]|nr:heterokaryon incompatibility protein-domain-containing protein [Pisolithus tinctorius]